MNASRFQRENKLCTHRDSDSSHWTSVCLHNTLDTWTRMLCYIAGFAPTKYPSSGISTMPAVPKASWEMTFIDIRQVSIPTYITK